MAPAWNRDSPSASSYEALKTAILLLYLDLVLLYIHVLHIIVMCMTLWLYRDTICVILRSISAMNIITGFPVKCRS